MSESAHEFWAEVDTQRAHRVACRGEDPVAVRADPEAAGRGSGSIDRAVLPARPADGRRGGARWLGLRTDVADDPAIIGCDGGHEKAGL
jgi:hypothetical protein